MIFRPADCYFGRNLDWEHDFGECVTVTPRRYPFRYRSGERNLQHYAMIGMAKVSDGYPLYFDAVNEFGLAMAGLNFVGNAHYSPMGEGIHELATFELIPYLLGRCRTVREARRLLESIRVTDAAFAADLPPADLHWMLADRESCITLEVTRRGNEIYDNPVGVLTNNPPFPFHLRHLELYRGLTAGEAPSSFSPTVSLSPHSGGIGAYGLPGDSSSASRFVRCAFTLHNSACPTGEEAAVSQMLHILASAAQVEGVNGRTRTQYAACCNMDTGVYYYQTYGCPAVTAVRLSAEDPEGQYLTRYPLRTEVPICTEIPLR